MRNVAFFEEKARRMRRELFEKFVLLQQGHPGSTFSMIDAVVALYYGGYVRRDPEREHALYDRLIVSKGHATVALYPVLADLGIIAEAQWRNWGSDPSFLRVFGNTSIPGIDATSGSLGHGLGIGAGYALSYRRRKSDQRVFVIISEGELYEGSTWESLLFVKHYLLDNLHLIIDRNHLIILGDTEACLGLSPMREKLELFGFSTAECNGHNYDELLGELDTLVHGGNGPRCLILDTIKGKGLRHMENKPQWHYWNPLSASEVAQCREELR